MKDNKVKFIVVNDEDIYYKNKYSNKLISNKGRILSYEEHEDMAKAVCSPWGDMKQSYSIYYSEEHKKWIALYHIIVYDGFWIDVYSHPCSYPESALANVQYEINSFLQLYNPMHESIYNDGEGESDGE